MFCSVNGDRPDARNIAIVITGFILDLKSQRTIPEAEKAQAKGIHICASGIGLTDKRKLIGIASQPFENNAFL